jgi:DNA-binding ferritin-like protein (Dps family)
VDEMIKKYMLMLSILFIVLLFASTSTASFSSYKQRICEKFGENSAFYKMLDRFLDTSSYNSDEAINNNILDISKDAALDDEQTIDINGEEGATLNEETIIDENGEVGAANDEIIIEEGGSDNNGTLECIIEIITERNGQIGEILQRVIKRSYVSEGGVETIIEGTVINGYIEKDNAENTVVEHVVLTSDDI